MNSSGKVTFDGKISKSQWKLLGKTQDTKESRSAEAKPVPAMDADGSGELRNSCSKFGSFFSVSSHSHLIPPIQCSVGCFFADCVAVSYSAEF
ncbi:hypothetical protein Tco_1182531 [Tanacetum coccineum]